MRFLFGDSLFHFVDLFQPFFLNVDQFVFFDPAEEQAEKAIGTALAPRVFQVSRATGLVMQPPDRYRLTLT